jgi:hypothetical protein
VLGDFTGHGRIDTATANSWAYANSISILPGNGDGTFATQLTYAATLPWAITTGDLNGDGHPDLATSSAGGTVSVLLSECR